MKCLKTKCSSCKVHLKLCLYSLLQRNTLIFNGAGVRQRWSRKKRDLSDDSTWIMVLWFGGEIDSWHFNYVLGFQKVGVAVSAAGWEKTLGFVIGAKWDTNYPLRQRMLLKYISVHKSACFFPHVHLVQKRGSRWERRRHGPQKLISVKIEQQKITKLL